MRHISKATEFQGYVIMKNYYEPTDMLSYFPIKLEDKPTQSIIGRNIEFPVDEVLGNRNGICNLI